MDGKKVLMILDECVDQQLLLKKLAMEVVLPALKAKVEESDNKIDDMVFAALEKLAEKL